MQITGFGISWQLNGKPSTISTRTCIHYYEFNVTFMQLALSHYVSLDKELLHVNITFRATIMYPGLRRNLSQARFFLDPVIFFTRIWTCIWQYLNQFSKHFRLVCNRQIQNPLKPMEKQTKHNALTSAKLFYHVHLHLLLKKVRAQLKLMHSAATTALPLLSALITPSPPLQQHWHSSDLSMNLLTKLKQQKNIQVSAACHNLAEWVPEPAQKQG